MVNGSVPETRYARTTDGLDIAYQTLGNGGVDVLKLATYFGNIEHDWASPGVAGVNRALAELGRLITCPDRGEGGTVGDPRLGDGARAGCRLAHRSSGRRRA